MMEMLVELAGQQSTAWIVLAIAAIVILLQIYKSSPEDVWGDFADEDE